MPRLRAPIAASGPPRVQAWLRGAGPGPVRVLHRSAAALYVEVGAGDARRCVGLVGSAAVAVPCALRVAAPTLAEAGLAPLDASVRTADGLLLLDDRPIHVARLVDPVVPTVPERLATLAEPPPPPSEELAGLPDPVDTDAVRALLGRGSGLTPLGDDLVCGWLAWHRAAGVSTPELDSVVESASGRTTLLSATLLDCARHGEVVPEFSAWVRAVGTPDEAAAARDLRSLGHTSGLGLWYGAQRARHALHRRTTHPADPAVSSGGAIR